MNITIIPDYKGNSTTLPVYKEYQSKHGYSVELPKNWQSVESKSLEIPKDAIKKGDDVDAFIGGKEYSISVYIDNSNKETDSSSNISINTYRANASLVKTIYGMHKNNDSLDFNQVMESIEGITINGVYGCKTKRAFQYAEFKGKALIYSMTTKSKSFLIAGITPLSEFSKRIETIEKIMKSFKLLS